MSDVSPINSKMDVIKDKFISGNFLRWLNELQVAVISSLRSDNQGVYIFPEITATEASALTAVDGMMVYVTDTDATFTSIGFWGYENGAWNKL